MPELSTEFWIGAALTVFALVIGIGVTLAMDAKTNGEFRVAVACFLVSAGVIIYGIGAWQMSVAWSTRSRMIVAYALFALVSVLTVEAVRWAHRRHLRAEAGPIVDIVPVPVPPPESTTPSPENIKVPTAEEIARQLKDMLPASSSEKQHDADNLQLRDPVLVIEPETAMLHSNYDYNFQFFLYNAGTSDVEAVEIYEDYYSVVQLIPFKAGEVGSINMLPNTTLPTLPSKKRAPFSIDYSDSYPALVQLAREGKTTGWIARIRLRYRRSSDGVRFTMGKVMRIVSERLLLNDSKEKFPHCRHHFIRRLFLCLKSPRRWEEWSRKEKLKNSYVT